jgi:pimeloyl-ACP methyl ester carboxylesterase
MFVLVHGGGHSSRCWQPTLPFLDAPVVVIDLPGRGAHPAPLDNVRLADWVDSAVGDLERTRVTDAVLVGHSMAGLTIPGMLERAHHRLRRVVFVSCTVPPEGKSLLDLLSPDLVEMLQVVHPSPGGIALSSDEVREMQCYDMDEEQARFTVDAAVPEAYWPTREPVSLAGLQLAVPRTWVRLTADRTVPAESQDEMARRAGCDQVIDLSSGHMAMISHPAELAAILNRVHAGS